jgi:hypothetical protein
MHDTARRVGLIVPFALISLAGCFSLGRNPPIDRQYVLGGAVRPEAATSPSKLADKSVGIRRLQLAPYLASPFILVRRGAHRITFSEFHRWGEDLEAGISRAVAGYLAGRAPFRKVAVAPWPLGEKFDYLIQLRVLHFEGVAPDEPAAGGGEVHMLTAWEIIRQQDGAVLARGTTDYREPGWRVDDYAGLVQLLDMGLSQLSQDLVASLENLITP